MSSLKRWIDRGLSFFVAGVVVIIWIGLAVWLVMDWTGFWKMVWNMRGKSGGIALMLLFGGPLWLLFKLRKVPQTRQKEVIERAGVVYLRPFTTDA